MVWEESKHTSLRVTMASVIMSAKTRQYTFQIENRSFPQLHTMNATTKNNARPHRDVVEGLELTLVRGMSGGGGLCLGCGSFGRHDEELMEVLE